MAKKRLAGRRPQRRASGSTGIYIAGAAIAVVLVAAVILLGAASRGGNNDGASAEVIVPTQRPAAVPANGTVYGDPAAPVTVTEYLDFQCPVCLRASLTVLAAIEKTYVETGKAKIEIKPIAILGDESVAAAAASRCATDQGRFGPYHDVLFANQGAENDGGYNNDRLKDFATRVGLDGADFNSCLDAKTYESQVKADTQASKGLGVKGTPTIFVDGTKVETSVEAISAAIEAGLSGG